MNRIDVQLIEIDLIPDTAAVKKFCRKILGFLDINNWELSILLCRDSFIKTLNRDYRGKDEPTDVLSFSQSDDNLPANSLSVVYAGDIVISLDTLHKNSVDFNVDINEEFKRLLIHGILHLKGLDHTDNNPESEMLAYQENLLAKVTGVNLF